VFDSQFTFQRLDNRLQDTLAYSYT
jgi:hypothetical protein